jgi:hypothetical protein
MEKERKPRNKNARRRESLLTSILNQIKRDLDPPTVMESDNAEPNPEARPEPRKTRETRRAAAE